MSAPRITPEDTNNYDKVHEAAAKGGTRSIKLIHYIEEQNINVDVLHSVDRETPISFAAQSGTLENLRYLIEKGASLDARERKHNLLYWAVQNPNKLLIDYITSPDLELHELFQDGTSALAMAIAGDRLAIVSKIITDDPAQIDQKDIHGHTPVYWAALVDNRKALELMSWKIKNYDLEPEYLLGQIDHINFVKCKWTKQEVGIKDYRELIELYKRLSDIRPLQPEEAKTCFRVMGNAGTFCCDEKDFSNAEVYYQQAVKLSEQMLLQNLEKEIGIIKEDLVLIKSLRVLYGAAEEYGVTPRFFEEKNDLYEMLLLEAAHLLHEPKRDAASLVARIDNIRQHIVAHQDLYNSEHKDSDLSEMVIFIHAMARYYRLNVAIFRLKDGEPDVTIFKCSKAAKNMYLCYSKEMGFEIAQCVQQRNEVALINVCIDSKEDDTYQSETSIPAEKLVDLNSNFFGYSSSETDDEEKFADVEVEWNLSYEDDFDEEDEEDLNNYQAPRKR